MNDDDKCKKRVTLITHNTQQKAHTEEALSFRLAERGQRSLTSSKLHLKASASTISYISSPCLYLNKTKNNQLKFQG